METPRTLSSQTLKELEKHLNTTLRTNIEIMAAFFTHLLPGMRGYDVMVAINLAHITCSSEQSKKQLIELRKRKLISIAENGRCYPVKAISLETAIRWMKEPLLQHFLDAVRLYFCHLPGTKNTSVCHKMHIEILLQALRLTNECSSLWRVICHIAQYDKEVFNVQGIAPVSTYSKYLCFKRLTQHYADVPTELPAELKTLFAPSQYRDAALTHLPRLLDAEQLVKNAPSIHDQNDDITDVLLQIALQTGAWQYFDSFAELGGEGYQLKTPHGYYNKVSRSALIDVGELVRLLQEWRSGKWGSLRKIRDILTYNNSQQAPIDDNDLGYHLFLAPLAILLNYKYKQLQHENMALIRHAYSGVFPTEASSLLHNCTNSLNLTAQTYPHIKWVKKHSIDLFPKSLSLAAMPSAPVLTADEQAELFDSCVNLHQNGLTLQSWYMANALLCLPILTPAQEHQLWAIMESRRDLPLLFPIKKKSAMHEVLLQNMEALLQQGTQSASPDAYLAWHILADENMKNAIRISAFVHKRLKSGKYSIGKYIPVDMLSKETYSSIITPQDALILKKAEQESLKSFFWTTDPPMTQEIAELLCGHPHLSLCTRTTSPIPIELVPIKRELTLTQQKDTLTLTVKQLTADDTVPLCQLGANKFGVVFSTEKGRRLTALLTGTSADGIVNFPIEHRERLVTILSGFADVFTLKGDLSSDATTEVSATPKAIAMLEAGRGVLKGCIMLELYPGTQPVEFFNAEKNYYTQLDGKALSIKRHVATEKKLREQIAAMCPTLHEVMDGAAHWQIELSDTMLKLLEELQQCDKQLLETRWQAGKALSIISMNDFSAFNINTTSATNKWLSIGGNVQVNESLVMQLSELLHLVNLSSGRYIELTQGHFLKLSKNIEEQLRALSLLAHVPGKGKRTREQIEISPALMLLLAQSNAAQALPPGLQKEAKELLKNYHAGIKLPRNVHAQLRDYQTEGYQWMQRLMNCGLGACLADDMGLGKTLQVLCVLLAHAAKGPSLVIAPSSVCNNWCAEAEKFTPTLNLYQLENCDRQEQVSKLGKRDVLVCSYGLLVAEAPLLTAVSWNVVVLDEAQYIKNSQTQRARTACALQAKCRIAATGTPIENSLDELWSIFDFINTGYLGNLEQFRARFSNNPLNRKLLRSIVAPFILRRLKADVLDELPEKTETTHYISLSDEERALYEACRREALIKTQSHDDRFSILAQLMRLRRLCCHPQLVDKTWTAESGKITALLEMAEALRESGHKALIFSQFTDMLKLVSQAFDRTGYSYLYLDGSTPKAKRGKLVDSFQEGEADFFLISLKAGGTGLNLTAADYVILLDPWWNPAVEAQAADRTHRMGQKRPVTVCRLVCKETIEEKVMALHADKRELFDQVINDTATSTPLSIAELLQLM